MEGNCEQNAKLPESFIALTTQNSNRLWAAIVVDQLVKSGVTQYYLSPGMRNAPLIAALHFHPLCNVVTNIDERSAGYQALGHAKATGTAACLVCTSGTAVANYLPAVIEAYHSDNKLIVLSSDRPHELVVAGDNQAIDQHEMYGKYAAWLGFDAPVKSISPKFIATSVSHHLARLEETPVHINMAFQEPLDGTPQVIENEIMKEARELILSPSPATSTSHERSLIGEDDLFRLEEILKSSTNPLVVIGELGPHHDKKKIAQFLENTNLPRYVDVTSSLKYLFPLDENSIPTFDHPEIFEYFRNNKVDTIIHLGGRTVSKHYYRFLKSSPETKVIHICDSKHQWDPANNVDWRIKTAPDLAAEQFHMRNLFNSIERATNPRWHDWVLGKREIIDQSPLTFPALSKSLVEIIPEDEALFLANSTTVRSFDNYISSSLKKNIDVYSNRGASGIEGNIATATGLARAKKQNTTVVIGDVSFIHDLNSLLSLKQSEERLTIVVVNNDGGGIFSLLPMVKETEIIPYMTTAHGMNFENACKQFNLEYTCVDSIHAFNHSYLEAMKKETHSVIEVKMDNNNNIELYKKLNTVRM